MRTKSPGGTRIDPSHPGRADGAGGLAGDCECHGMGMLSSLRVPEAPTSHNISLV